MDFFENSPMVVGVVPENISLELQAVQILWNF